MCNYRCKLLLLQMASLGSTPNGELINLMVEAVKADFLASGGNLAYFDDATIREQVMKRLAGESSDDDGTCQGGSGPPPNASVEKQQETVRASPYFAALAASRARQEAKKKEEEEQTKKKE